MKTTRGTANIPESQRHTEAVKLRLLPEDAQKLRAVAAARGLPVSGLVASLIRRITLGVLLCGLLASLCVGCGAQGGTNYDPAFTGQEEAAIAAGFGEWPTTPDTALDIVRVTDTNESEHPDCVDASEGSLSLAVTSLKKAHICFYVDRIARDEASSGVVGELQTVAAHEYGHALGLKHTDASAPAIMRPFFRSDITTVQAADLAALEAR
jgi:hypothetical protein